MSINNQHVHLTLEFEWHEYASYFTQLKKILIETKKQNLLCFLLMEGPALYPFLKSHYLENLSLELGLDKRIKERVSVNDLEVAPSLFGELDDSTPFFLMCDEMKWDGQETEANQFDPDNVRTRGVFCYFQMAKLEKALAGFSEKRLKSCAYILTLKAPKFYEGVRFINLLFPKEEWPDHFNRSDLEALVSLVPDGASDWIYLIEKLKGLKLGQLPFSLNQFIDDYLPHHVNFFETAKLLENKNFFEMWEKVSPFLKENRPDDLRDWVGRIISHLLKLREFHVKLDKPAMNKYEASIKNAATRTWKKNEIDRTLRYFTKLERELRKKDSLWKLHPLRSKVQGLAIKERIKIEI